MKNLTEIQKQYEKVFEMFVSRDSTREKICHPFKQNALYCATDGISLITMSAENLDLPFPEQEKPDITRVIPDQIIYNIEIQVSEIEKQLIPEMVDEIEKLESETVCRECDGNGFLECDLGHEHDCIECDGEGSYITRTHKPTGKKVPRMDKKYIMLDVAFHYAQLKRLVDACNLMQVKTIIKTYGGATGPNNFKCGDVEILVMPALLHQDDPEEAVLVLITSNST